jgi:hypothetical protein
MPAGRASPTRYELLVIQQRYLCELRDADDAAALRGGRLLLLERVACGGGQLCAKEVPNADPEIMLPVVEALQPGLFVDLLDGAVDGLAEAMHLGEVADELLRIVDVIDPELQLRLVTGVKMQLRLLVRSKSLVGADGEVGMRSEGARQAKEEQKAEDYSSRRMFQR